MTNEKQSKYDIIEKPTGFKVVGRDRNPVEVYLEPTCLTVHYFRPPTFIGEQEKPPKPEYLHFNFFEYYFLSHYIASGLMAFWERPAEEVEKRPYEPKWLRPWLVKQTAGAIGKRVHAQWNRLLSLVDPEALAVHKAIFVANFNPQARPDSTAELYPDFYRNPHIIHDVQAYRAAAIVARNYRRLLRRRLEGAGIAYPELEKILEDSLSALINNWDNWPALYSISGKTYRTLNRTLFNLPGRIPPTLLQSLNKIRLQRPITKRLELVTLLKFCQRGQLENENILQHATAEQIKTAMGRVSDHLRRNLSPNRLRDIELFTVFIADYPESHSGNIVGLADKAIDWHRHQQERERQRIISHYGELSRLASPPIALPGDDGISFLSTIGELATESETMGHCIAGYALKAISGDCYLFHIEYGGDRATVEVDPGGRVLQAQGPRNQDNKAARWGRRLLNRWGKQIPMGASPVLYSPEPKPREVTKTTIDLSDDLFFNRLGELEIERPRQSPAGALNNALIPAYQDIPF